MKHARSDNEIGSVAIPRRRARPPQERQYLRDQMRQGRIAMAEALRALTAAAPRLLEPRVWIEHHPRAAAVAVFGVVLVAGRALNARRRRRGTEVPDQFDCPSAPLVAKRGWGFTLGALCSGAWHTFRRAVLGAALTELVRGIRAAPPPTDSVVAPSPDGVR